MIHLLANKWKCKDGNILLAVCYDNGATGKTTEENT